VFEEEPRGDLRDTAVDAACRLNRRCRPVSCFTPSSRD